VSATRRRSFRAAGKRLGWGAGDQVLSTLTNFLLSVAVARSASASGFGVFSLAYSAFVLLIGFSRASISEPFSVRYAKSDADAWRAAARTATGAGLAEGIVGGLAFLGAGLLASGSDRTLAIAFGLTMPGLMLQDTWRYCYVTQGRTDRAFLTDAIFLGAMVPSLLLVGAAGGSSAGFVAVWGGSATLAAIVAVVASRTPPGLRAARAWFSGERELSLRYTGEYVAVYGAAQLTFFAIAWAAGVEATGSVRAGFILFGPAILILQASRLLLIPEGVRLLERSKQALLRGVLVLAIVLPLTTLAWAAVLLALPDRWGVALLGASWEGGRALVVPIAVVEAASAVELAALIGLRALAAARYSMRARLAESVLTVTGGTVGAVTGGALGATWGMAVANLLEDVVWWRQFLRGFRAHAGGSVAPPAGVTPPDPTV
jgi:O-antigen/teichoic acid export membrane protein